MTWTPFHEELRQGAKRGLSRATRFIFLELSLESREGCGWIRSPVGMTDLDALHDILGGNKKEGPERARTLRIPCWSRCNSSKGGRTPEQAGMALRFSPGGAA